MSAKNQSGETPAGPTPEAAGPRELPPAAVRALQEAEARRRQQQAEAAAQPKELGGRQGPDPVRYGDWEHGGIASDF